MCLAWWHCQFHNLVCQVHASLWQVWNSKDWEVRVWALPGAPPIELLELCVCCAKSNVNLHANFVLHLMSPHGLYTLGLTANIELYHMSNQHVTKMGWILSSTHLVTLFTNHLYRYALTKSIIIFCNPFIKIQHSSWLRPDKN